MTNRKIAVVIDSLAFGGVAVAACNFIRCLSQQYEITVYVRDFEKSQSAELPENVKCKPWSAKETVSDLIRKKKPCRAIAVLFHEAAYMLHFRNFGKRIVDKARCRATIKDVFDCVIGYHMVANDVTVMTLEKICAPRKLLWLHNQKKYLKRDIEFYQKLYSRADGIVCVSKDTETRFQSLLPKCAEKTVTIHNFYNFEKIRKMSTEPLNDVHMEEGEVCIVSVGRISKEKGFDRVPDVAKRLKEDGVRFQWIIVGDGDCRADVEHNVHTYGLEDCVKFAGHQKNPYSYIGKCDIYVQPSYSEGYCTSTVEAKILEKPVVTTDVPGMNEQFDNGENGLITESSVEGIYGGIRMLLNDAELKQKIERNLHENPLSDDEELARTIQLINGIEQ